MIHHERLRPPLRDFPADEWNLVESGFHPEFALDALSLHGDLPPLHEPALNSGLRDTRSTFRFTPPHRGGRVGMPGASGEAIARVSSFGQAPAFTEASCAASRDRQKRSLC
jgi:hypothetical protein